MNDNPKKYTPIQLPSWMLWAFLLASFMSGSVGFTKAMIMWFGPDETPATERCREVVNGSIGIKYGEGILCVRPVYFIER